jgi:hypothetical protein
MRASPISALLSAIMISSDGTQFGLDLLVVQVDYWNLQAAQLVGKPKPVPSSEFRSLAQREMPDFEESNGELQPQLAFYLATRFAARHKQIIRIFDLQFSHDRTLPATPMYSKGREDKGNNQSQTRSISSFRTDEQEGSE